MDKRLILIDGNSLINRAYYAIQRPMITRDGIYTQGIYGFLNMLFKMEAMYPHSHMAVCWDMKSPTFRHKEYSDYKAGRKKMPLELAMQLPLIKEALDYMNIVNVELEGFEADDLIGTLSKMAEKEKMPCLIVTGDRDALQLASESTHVLITKKGISDFDIFDEKKMEEVYQMTPAQFIDLKGLMGDKSDNIPGLPGVGQVTATKLILQFGSIENMYQHLDDITNAKLRAKMEDNLQLAMMSKRLATINRNAPLETSFKELEKGEPDYEKLLGLYKKLEFNSFIAKLSKEMNQSESSQENIAFGELGKEDVKELEFITPTSLDEFKECLPKGEKNVVLKVLWNGKHSNGAEVYAIGLSWEGKAIILCDENFDEALKLIKEYIERYGWILEGHNLKDSLYTLGLLKSGRYKIAFDTSICEYLINPAGSSEDMSLLAIKYGSGKLESQAELFKSIAKKKKNKELDDINREVSDYMKIFLSAYNLSKPQILKEGERLDLIAVLQSVEIPLIETLLAMELQGFTCDRAILLKQGEELADEIASLESSIYKHAGHEFNINSPRQLGQVLFDDLGLPVIKKTKTGYSTSAEVLDKLKDSHPIIEEILEYRGFSKIKSTYVDGLLKLISVDGKIRPTFLQMIAATGRLSCVDPNLQNIPIRMERGRQIRKAFRPSDHSILVGADYSQIELRVLADLSGDDEMIEAFNKGEDIHRATAARVFGIKPEDVSPLDRSRAKAVNFGVIYGMSDFGLSEELGISRADAEKYISDYFKHHPKVKKYMDGEIAYAKENGYTKTFLGRKRFIPEIKASNFFTRKLGERLAMNSPIQGTAADIIKLAMNKVYNRIREDGLNARLILQIHDELIIDTPIIEEERVKRLLRESMEEAVYLKVKLLADVNTGKDWYDLK